MPARGYGAASDRVRSVDLKVRGRLALVTGASSGIGRAIALALAAEGVRVAVAARRADLLEEVAERARGAGAPEAQGFPVDLSDAAAVDGMLASVRDRMGDVEILILNGGGPKPGTYQQVTAADWEAAHRSTLRAMLQLVDGVLPAMRSRRWGRIVALASTSVEQPISNLVLSNAYRTALVAALKTLSGEVAREGITVNAIATGRVATDRLFAIYGSEAEMREAAEREVPAGRVATPEEFAPPVAFLCGEGAGYVTGQTIAIDGGLVRGLFG
jgi:3-oxoacyl-[acyl-carrier protein] reductase